MDILILFIVAMLFVGLFVYSLEKDYKKNKAKEEAKKARLDEMLKKELEKGKFVIKLHSAEAGVLYTNTISPRKSFWNEEIIPSKEMAEEHVVNCFKKGFFITEENDFIPACKVYKVEIIKESEKEL